MDFQRDLQMQETLTAVSKGHVGGIARGASWYVEYFCIELACVFLFHLGFDTAESLQNMIRTHISRFENQLIVPNTKTKFHAS